MGIHRLKIIKIEDEGIVDFEIECIHEEGAKCSIIEEYEYAPTDICIMKQEWEQIGREIIRGTAEGSGPWEVKLVYEGDGGDSEGWIEFVT